MACFIALAISTGSSAFAMAEFIKTPSHPSSIALAASLAQPTPASTRTGTLELSFINLILKKLSNLLNQKGVWVEASDALEHILYKMGVPYIEDEDLIEKKSKLVVYSS